MNIKANDNETELRSLMTRVMSAPLRPLHEQIESMEARIGKLEGMTTDNRVATFQISEAVGAIHKDLGKRLDGLLEDLQEGLAERVEPLAGELGELGQQQKNVLAGLDAARNEASERGKSLCAALAAFGECVQTSLTRLDDLHMTTSTANTQHTATLDNSLERLRELRTAADAATVRHGEAFSALEAGLAMATSALSQQHEQTQEIVAAQRAQQIAQQEAELNFTTLLAGLRTELDASLSSQVEAARTSILAGIHTHGAERQQGLEARLKLITALTVVSLLALAGFAIVHFAGRG
jgi:RNase H-fold protein (predicted Holliday junction resolvase)